ncbi:MAG: RDD family protein [Chloroflexota bacterium]
MEYVGVGRRAVAIIIDGIVYFILAWIIAAATGGTTSGGFELNGGPAFLSFALFLVYYVGLEMTRGATLGKMALGIRVLKEDGTPLDLQASLIRNILRIVDGQLAYLVGAILVWKSDKKQRLGDRVAHTIVVRA